MPELDLRSPCNTGFPFESSHLDLEIYRLLTAVAASSVLTERADDEVDGPKWKWLKKMELPEISRLLVSIAAIARNNIDSCPGSRQVDARLIERPVGFLIPDLSAPNSREPLGFRESCNKVLHADFINPEVTDLSKALYSALKPLVHLYGSHRGSDWRATVHVYEFAMTALALC
ncbi:MAG: hypothetical protein PVG71_08895 [Anaerolineae bacterium]|jgi:hypothetical protein